MPRRNLVLEENQPSIKTLLPNCPTPTKSECTEHDPTVLNTIGDADIELIDIDDSNKIKKRKRKHRLSGSPKEKPNKKFLQKTPTKMEKPKEIAFPLPKKP